MTVEPHAVDKSAVFLIGLFAALVFWLSGLAGCQSDRGDSKNAKVAAPGSPPVFVATAWPIQYLTQRIAGDDIRIVLVARPRAAASDWYPDAAQIAQLQAARLVFSNGAGWEPWLQNVTLKSSRVVETTAGLQANLIPRDDSKVHRHGPEGLQSTQDVASHTWLDPELAINQSRAIRDCLVQQLPDKTAVLERNFSLLESGLIELKRQARSIVAGNRPPIIDIYGHFPYLLRAAELQSTPFPFDESQVIAGSLDALTPAELQPWRNSLFLVPANADPVLLNTLQEKGLATMLLDDLESDPASGDFLSLMHDNLQHLKQAMLRE